MSVTLSVSGKKRKYVDIKNACSLKLTKKCYRGFTDYSYLGLFVPGLFVPSMDYSYLGLFVPWTVRTLLDCSYHGLFVPSFDFSYPGLFVPWTVRTLLDCSYHALFVPSLDDSYHVEKGNIVYTV